MQHLGADLLGQQRQPGLLPGQPRRSMADRGRRRKHVGVGHQSLVPLRVRTQAHHRKVGSTAAEGSEQAIDVAADATAVCWDAGRVDQHAG